MRILKKTLEIRTDSEEEAKQIIEKYRQDASEEGYLISAAGYTYKTKKSKGEIISEKWLCKIVLVYGDIWED